jgi:hypothetical protein
MRWIREIRDRRCADEKVPSPKLEILGWSLRITEVTKVLDEISRRGFSAGRKRCPRANSARQALVTSFEHQLTRRILCIQTIE